MATETVALDGDLNAEALEVDDNGKDNQSREEVHDVGETLPPEGLLEGARLVVPGEEEVEKCDDGTLEFGAATGVDGSGGERFPDDALANIGRNEERDTGTKTVSLLQELIEQDDDESADDELKDEQQADTRAKLRGLAV